MEAAMPDLIVIITIASVLAMAFALWRARHHGVKIDRLLEERDL
jgi:hypothetical protein